MNIPQVSVVMPVYNAERYLTEAVESILSQTFTDFEFLIFDDGSTDRSLAILRTYAERDTRVHLFPRLHKGYVPWLNEGIHVARGEYIARMDADDISLPERLTRQVQYLRTHPDYVALGCSMLVVDADGLPLTEFIQNTEHETIEADMLEGRHGVIGHPTCMMKRSALLSIGCYREDYEPIEDFDLWFRLAERGRLANLPEVLFKYRLHHANVVFTQVDRQGQHADRIITEARLKRGLKPLSHTVWGFTTPTLAGRHQIWAWYAAGGGHRKTAIKHALIALSVGPLNLKSWIVIVRCCLPHGIVLLLRRLGFPDIWKNKMVDWKDDTKPTAQSPMQGVDLRKAVPPPEYIKG
jgi:GT2 family glycosyltransferase